MSFRPGVLLQKRFVSASCLTNRLTVVLQERRSRSDCFHRLTSSSTTLIPKIADISLILTKLRKNGSFWRRSTDTSCQTWTKIR